MKTVKTAISIPDKIFEDADQVAKKLKISRSELYSTAISDFVKKQRNKAVTDELNRIYSKEESNVDPFFDLIQQKSLLKEKW